MNNNQYQKMIQEAFQSLTYDQIKNMLPEDFIGLKHGFSVISQWAEEGETEEEDYLLYSLLDSDDEFVASILMNPETKNLEINY